VNDKKIINGLDYILKGKKWIRDISDNRIIELYKKYGVINKVAKELKIDNSTVKNRLLKYNIHINSLKESLNISMNDIEVKEKLKNSYKGSIEKRKKTNLEKYGVEFASQSEAFQDKVNKTSLEKYGVEHFLSNKEVINKRVESNINKYGVSNVSQVDDIKLKRDKTFIDKFGTSKIFTLESIKEKSKETLLRRYGENNPSKIDVFKIKRKKTNLDLYGSEYFLNSDIAKERILKIKSEKFIYKLIKILEYIDLELLDEYKHAHYLHKWRCKKCGNVFEQIWNIIQQGYKCPSCNPRIVSTYENELRNFILEIIPSNSIEYNIRSIIKPKELDIYIPSKNIAIEFNGLYWHDENHNKDSKYHLNKTLKCKEQNIKLIHIFEDEWIFKKDIVKNRLRQILRVNNSQKIHARKCIVKEIDSKTKNEFLEKYHIQGPDTSKIKLGLFYNNELISTMTFSHGNISKGSRSIPEVWELNRFCSNSNYIINGAASKLLEYFKRNYSWRIIFSYADRRWSDGNLYYRLGFELNKETAPNYWYIKGLERIHRFNLRKNNTDPKDIPEWILRYKEGYSRIWDCGSLKFILKNSGSL